MYFLRGIAVEGFRWSGMLPAASWRSVTDISEQHIGGILDRLTLENGVDMLSRNVGNQLPTYASTPATIHHLAEEDKFLAD
jgi:hypothetical protein